MPDWSNGHFGRTTTSSGRSTSPAVSRSTPAHAIMTPLSVHQRAGGYTARRPASSATAQRRVRNAALRATPPATTRLAGAGATCSCVHAMARLVFLAMCSRTMCWKLAAKSAGMEINIVIKNTLAGTLILAFQCNEHNLKWTKKNYLPELVCGGNSVT